MKKAADFLMDMYWYNGQDIPSLLQVEKDVEKWVAKGRWKIPNTKKFAKVALGVLIKMERKLKEEK